MIKTFIYRALNSPVTTGAGAFLAWPDMVTGINSILADSPEGGIDWKALMTGVFIVLVGMSMRDTTDAWITQPASKPKVK